jgi:hypothetical protein
MVSTSKPSFREFQKRFFGKPVFFDTGRHAAQNDGFGSKNYFSKNYSEVVFGTSFWCRDDDLQRLAYYVINVLARSTGVPLACVASPSTYASRAPICSDDRARHHTVAQRYL